MIIITVVNTIETPMIVIIDIGVRMTIMNVAYSHMSCCTFLGHLFFYLGRGLFGWLLLLSSHAFTRLYLNGVAMRHLFNISCETSPAVYYVGRSAGPVIYALNIGVLYQLFSPLVSRGKVS